MFTSLNTDQSVFSKKNLEAKIEDRPLFHDWSINPPDVPPPEMRKSGLIKGLLTIY